MVRSPREYDWAISRYIERPSWPYFTEENVRDSLPEQKSSLVYEVCLCRHDRVGTRARRMHCVLAVREWVWYTNNRRLKGALVCERRHAGSPRQTSESERMRTSSRARRQSALITSRVSAPGGSEHLSAGAPMRSRGRRRKGGGSFDSHILRDISTARFREHPVGVEIGIGNEVCRSLWRRHRGLAQPDIRVGRATGRGLQFGRR